MSDVGFGHLWVPVILLAIIIFILWMIARSVRKNR